MSRLWFSLPVLSDVGSTIIFSAGKNVFLQGVVITMMMKKSELLSRISVIGMNDLMFSRSIMENFSKIIRVRKRSLHLFSSVRLFELFNNNHIR